MRRAVLGLAVLGLGAAPAAAQMLLAPEAQETPAAVVSPAPETVPLPRERPDATFSGDILPAAPEEAVAGPADGFLDVVPPPDGAVPALPTVTEAPPPASPAPGALGAPGGPDLAYGAFQRGFYLTAFDIAIGRAESGDRAAQTLIALIYEHGYGVPQDFRQAVDWYRLAADAGDREAQFALGMMLMQGRGAGQDPEAGTDYIEKAANQGQVDAMYNLGRILIEGRFRVADPVRAAELLAAAAAAGSPDSQYALARILAAGVGGPPDPVNAAKWHLLARSSGKADGWLDSFVAGLPPEQQQAAMAAAQAWPGG